ncbi:hypothetical protein C6P41_002626 [Kluyveromyces marxianus]|uniref:Uncharacterized protein n=2 Tax=Kluyveromyces marxianus TaxID=4911 RepID=W0T9S9_KLUMD|nr:hypothetical protein KLMA_40348 [Kluyveromyces marxianus DMKU3-1042]KAG0669322.1 hypothetical protein C6P43_003668 [Kluyveromyces marxianus]KAG0685928.1 hypothetical protein C6P41_002626 [Kluyveromyces marxianus]QGN16105.1 hypothetical protein FIM1_2806 [Kluyveromyces marxianus]BAO40372.1 hypothetical protein KLMA_40348 [Kluyveromyces marxianus DMKU3-1042]BAP71861.1 hypothetical protein KLMA_40348 [Kluyveromyces marxianus]
MLRRDPTVLSLTADDISELQEHLEEYKLQREIKAQHLNLLRSSSNPNKDAQLKSLNDNNFIPRESMLYSLHKMTPSRQNKPTMPLDRGFDQAPDDSNAQESANPFYASNSNND